MIAIDSSVLVRYLVGTPEPLARRAARVIDDEATIGVPVVVLLESAHVLRTQYGVTRSDILETMIGLVTRRNVDVLGLPRSVVIEALGRARTLPGGPLADALVAATARATNALPLYTFDADMAHHGVPVAQP